MKLSRVFALILAMALAVISLSSCIDLPNLPIIPGLNDTTAAETTEKPKEPTDFEYIMDKGTLLVGITDYAPMNYIDDNGEWAGFDTEFALLVGEELGLDVEFVTIANWEEKWDDLNSKKIDCVWNGMTLTDDATENASCTDTYVRNAQVIVIKAENASKYTSVESLANDVIAVEAGSAGRDVAKNAGLNYTEFPYQSDALMAVDTGKAAACVIDITMANATTGKGTTYDGLKTAFALSEEEYAIACRQDSDLCDKINAVMADLIADGTLSKLAAKYDLTLSDN